MHVCSKMFDAGGSRSDGKIWSCWIGWDWQRVMPCAFEMQHRLVQGEIPWMGKSMDDVKVDERDRTHKADCTSRCDADETPPTSSHCRPAKVGSAALKASKVISSLSKLNPFAKSNKTPPKVKESMSFKAQGSPKLVSEFSRARSTEEDLAAQSERRGRQRAPLAESFAEPSREHHNHHHRYQDEQKREQEQEQHPIYSTMSKSNSHDAFDTKIDRISAPVMMRNKSETDLISMGDDDDSSRCIETAIFTTPEESPRSSLPSAPSPSPAKYLTRPHSQDYSSPTQHSASSAQNLQENLNQTTPPAYRRSYPGNVSSGAQSFSSPFSRSSPMPPSPAPYSFRGEGDVSRSSSNGPEVAQRSPPPQVVKGTTVTF